ncbi:fimbrial protein [Kosakonia cowanii]|jgi:major type 1 subunit fimbrin (pilin)|uniref:fimbrial protein n=1 Tax=Kosakonia cowanii TaxID=208223 RepID=UPI000FECE124|nr:fimbrial protein [Kosakonia cowanii]QAR47754.1 type 1 fimbrial protein [Kosakonia cowanii]
MKMRLANTAFIVWMGLAGTAQAADGTIYFTGSITDQTCAVDSGSQSMNVDLGKVSVTTLNGSAGLKAAPTHFSITLNDCPDTVTALKVKFDGTAHAVNQRLLSLDSGSNVASGVGIEIADKNGSVIPLYSASGDYTLDEGSNTLDFTARYVSTGTTVTTGTANATSQFTLNYR